MVNWCAGGHINPAVTFGLLLARKLSLTRALFYIVMQCLGAICGAGVVKGFEKHEYMMLGGGANTVAPGYTKGDALGAEIVGTFVLVYTVFSATDAKRSARDSHVPVSIYHSIQLIKIRFIMRGYKLFVDNMILINLGLLNWVICRSWRPCQLGSRCSWFILQRFPLQGLVSTQRGVSVRPSSTTGITPGMTT